MLRRDAVANAVNQARQRDESAESYQQLLAVRLSASDTEAGGQYRGKNSAGQGSASQSVTFSVNQDRQRVVFQHHYPAGCSAAHQARADDSSSRRGYRHQ
jgi:hypothetical protein